MSDSSEYNESEFCYSEDSLLSSGPEVHVLGRTPIFAIELRVPLYKCKHLLHISNEKESVRVSVSFTLG